MDLIAQRDVQKHCSYGIDSARLNTRGSGPDDARILFHAP